MGHHLHFLADRLTLALAAELAESDLRGPPDQIQDQHSDEKDQSVRQCRQQAVQELPVPLRPLYGLSGFGTCWEPEALGCRQQVDVVRRYLRGVKGTTGERLVEQPEDERYRGQQGQ